MEERKDRRGGWRMEEGKDKISLVTAVKRKGAIERTHCSMKD